ncbi:fumarate/nitrate reduction transcriptional regulator Fnr [Aliikangiella coralliicola]|uniref:fumarate/nitrate reduction transcriptional regulator Fnr n=1 Tax=Aliikangiella coralliicola TaxID=2592383 RepID=UPI00143DE2AE|nr:fumarate/nitrate reduction transcriptional regulator Fnr [Aliikangiella coralliicola]
MSSNSSLRSEIKCQTCSIRRLCLPVMLADSEIEHLDNIVQRKKVLKKNEFLFHAGDQFDSIHAIRSGSLKTYTISTDGTEQITGFHLPGEIVGLNAISSTQYPSFAKALETSMVCTIPFDKLESLSRDIPGLQKQIFKVMSGEIREEQELMMLLNKKNADERFAAFIMNLSARFKRRGLSDKEFQLTMTRGDIGNYLGLAVETVSRLVTRLQKQELIAIQDRYIQIVNQVGLSQLAGTACHI